MAKNSADRYKKLLDKVKSLDLGGREYWRPPQGRTTIRILPAVGGMNYFFREVGEHYIDKKRYLCPSVCTDGKESCPCCEINQLLYDAGEKEAAGVFRVRRSFWMNIIIRKNEDAGPRVYTPGITIFNSLVALISDPDYGDVSDVDEGTDINIDREGEGLKTEYQVVAKRNPSALGEDDQIDIWLEAAKDIEKVVAGRLLGYDEMAEQTGAALYLDADEEDYAELASEEDEPVKASDKITKRLERRRSHRRRR